MKLQGELKVPVHLFVGSYSECTYGYNNCWKWPPSTLQKSCSHTKPMYGTCWTNLHFHTAEV